jgi:energy-coupling factor transport system ATP-binding protein
VTQPVIEARGWGWRHAGRREWATRGLDLRVSPGERVLLLGPSGSGKSTLLLAAAGLLDPAGGGESSGELRVHGTDPRLARDRTGIVFQDPEAQLIMARAGDDVAFGLENRCVPADRIWPTVDKALRDVGWRFGRGRPTAALSGGEKQRLALAGSLALRPSLLLLDEPTANLDRSGVAAFQETLARLLADDADDADGKRTLVIVEHRIGELLDLVTRVVVLEAGGGIVLDGAPRELIGTHLADLERRGVWVPNHPGPTRPAVPGLSSGHGGRALGPIPRAPLVLAESAGFTYPGASTPALAPTDLALRAGEAVAVVGDNGSGKSTLLLLLAGLLRPTVGRVVAGVALPEGWGGEVLPARAGVQLLWRMPARDLVRRIGMVFQDPEHQFLTPSVRAELLLGPRRAGLDEGAAVARADELLERLGLAALAEANPFTLSGGEQRRLSVGSALGAAPEVLILDEPTFGLDRRTWLELVRLLGGLRDEGRAIAFASHDLDFLAELSDRQIELEVTAREWVPELP